MGRSLRRGSGLHAREAAATIIVPAGRRRLPAVCWATAARTTLAEWARRINLAIDPGLVRHFGYIQEMHYVNGKLAVLSRIGGEYGNDPFDRRDERGAALPTIEQYGSVIDPTTARIIYSGVMRPHAGQKKLSAEEIQKLWVELASANEAAGDLAAWRIARGRDGRREVPGTEVLARAV